jgi:glyoxylase-like metal-dependent hydrolase (beta-lactamase superfamily II)
MQNKNGAFEEEQMRKLVVASLILMTGTATAWSQAQQPPAQPPAPAPAAQQPAQAPSPQTPRAVKVEGTDNVYYFSYRFYNSMFVVTPAGVIATDPSGLQKPEAVKAYIEEIRKITQAPIKYVVYSHHHFDHIAGGKPFKDLGATFIAHRNAKERLMELKYPDVVIPDQVVDDKRTIRLGGTTLELLYLGENHSDNMLVMRLPKEKIVFVVDFAPIQSLQFRGMPDNVSPLAMEESLKRLLALDWERMIPGHPGPGGRLGTKQDVRDHLAYLQELSAEVKKAADAGKCWDAAIREIRLPKYESWANYAQYLPGNIERYCYWWGRGY